MTNEQKRMGFQQNADNPKAYIDWFIILKVIDAESPMVISFWTIGSGGFRAEKEENSGKQSVTYDILLSGIA